MISRDRLYNILVDIKEELSTDIDPLKEGVDIKLNRAENNYLEAVAKNCQYILSRNNCKAMRIINKYMSNKETDNGEETKYGFIKTY